ncbi:MAG: sulfurtransferase [Chloroflexota bacterium]|nr:sulfurtransferase [Chloroflexota bacterium]
MSISSIVSTEWLAAHLNDANLRIVDVRWYLLDKDKNGRDEYLRGHIPGAIFLDVDTDLAAPRGQGPGRHPLPRADAFAETMARAGIGVDTNVIAYDDCGGVNAARVWWLLRHFGHAQVSLLDGGVTRWIAEGRPLQTQIPPVPRTNFIALPRAGDLADQKLVDTLRSDPRALVLDVRVPERYEGKIEPLDPRAGHVPGAKNAPAAGNLRAPDDPRFLDADALRARYAALGADQAERVAAYCGSGINACQTIFALHLVGRDDALLYEGSWSDWSRTPGTPVATGPNP